MTDYKFKLFLSYARNDDEKFVRRLYDDLVLNNFDVWFDRVSMPSRALTFHQEIRDAICEIDRLILIIGPQALASDYVRQEWEFALHICTAVTPVLRLGDYNQLRNLPDEIGKTHCVNMCEDRPYRTALDELLEIIIEPVAPLGKLHGVDEIPQYFLERSADIHVLANYVMADLNKPVVITSEKQTTTLQGMGGVGKSVIAAAFARACTTRRAFGDGIIWLKIGRDIEPDRELRRALAIAGRALGDSPDNYLDEVIGRQSLQELLCDRTCLLILDDVWDAGVVRPFLDAVAQTRNRLLITTRSTLISNEINANQHKVKLLTPEQALAFLRNRTGSADPKLVEVAERLDYLPLALNLAGALIKEGRTAEQWLAEYATISEMKLTDASDPTRNLEASIEQGVRAVFSENVKDRLLYHTFGIFPEDVPIPQVLVLRLWREIFPDSTTMNEARRKNYLDVLVRLALVEREIELSVLTLHDLLHDYTREKLGDEAPRIHQALLNTYRSNPHQDWYTITFDEYLYRYFPHHMIAAGWRDTLFAILTKAPDWLETSFEQTGQRDNDMEDMLLATWTHYRQHDRTSAHRFLRTWLKRRKVSVYRDGAQEYSYSSKVVAARCAFEAKELEGLVAALIDQNQQVQDIATRLIYYLDTTDPEAALDVLQRVGQQVMRMGLPNRHVIQVLVSVVTLLLVEGYNRGEFGTSNAHFNELIAIIRHMARRVTYVGASGGMQRIIGNRARTLLLKAVKLAIRRMLQRNQESKLRRSVNNFEEYAGFFELSPDLCENFRQVIPYIDHTHGSITDIRDHIVRIFVSQDMASRTYVNLALASRARQEPVETFEVCRYVFNTIRQDYADNPNLTVSIAEGIAHTLYHTLFELDDIPAEWLDYQKQVVKHHMMDGVYEPGVYATRQGRYFYYSLMYYGALFNKQHPADEIDLVKELLADIETRLQDQLAGIDETSDQIAERKQKARAQLLYIIGSFGERATLLKNYGSVLRSLEAYVHHDDDEIRTCVADALAVMRNKNVDAVDDFMKSVNASVEFRNLVKRKSFNESLNELSRRFHGFMVAFLTQADPETTLPYLVEAVTRIVEQADSLDVMIELGTKELLSGLIGEQIFAG